MTATVPALRRTGWAPVAAGASVGLLGGMIGLGGAELRLPLLIGLFGFAALSAVVLNKALSLVVVATALPARLGAVPFGDLVDRADVVLTLLAGSLLGAWVGAAWASRLRTATLHRVLGALLVLLAVVLVAEHLGGTDPLGLDGAARTAVGVVAGFGIGVVAAVMGVAGGELLIPTTTVLYGVDVALAGSVSLAVSLPTVVVALARYRRDGSTAVLHDERRFLLLMAAGSVGGTLVGGLLLGVLATALVVPLLVVLLLLSALQVWRHAPRGT